MPYGYERDSSDPFFGEERKDNNPWDHRDALNHQHFGVVAIVIPMTFVFLFLILGSVSGGDEDRSAQPLPTVIY
jgi:hypothetical protein